MGIRTFARLVMVEQSLFGLPWVIASALLALRGDLAHSVASLSLWFWVVVAFVAARTAGMALNRLIDREIDAANPRTAQRPLSSGEISSRQVTFLAVGTLLLFIVACGFINLYCLAMSPLAVLLLWLYSYSKRYTSLCHFVLGMVHFFIPLFTWAAFANSFDIIPFLIGGAIWASIAGSDIVYALQDHAFDCRYGIHSIPAAIGIRASLVVARLLHALAVVMLAGVGLMLGSSIIFFIGVASIAVAYLYFHLFIDGARPEQIDRRFFRCNVAAALLFLCSVLGDLVWHASL